MWLELMSEGPWAPELTWLAQRLHLSHHSMVQGAPGEQSAVVLQVAWQREFPGMYRHQVRHLSRGQSFLSPALCVCS